MTIAITIGLAVVALILLFPKPLRWTIKRVGPVLLLALCFVSLILFFRLSGRTAVTITATGERNELAEGKEIWLKSVIVDGKEYPAQELFSKGWIPEEGYLKWRGYDRPDYFQDTITGKIPSGKIIKLVFETSKWRGIVAVETETERYLFDTYSPGDKPKTQTAMLEIPGKATAFVVNGKSLIFGLLGGLTFLAVAFTAIDFFRKRKGRNGDTGVESAAVTHREIWLDAIKNIAAFFIVVIHAVGAGYSGTFGTPQWTGFLILNTLPRFAVPVFIMASGAQLLGKEIPLQKALKKAGRAFLLLLAWNLIYMLLRRILWGTGIDYVKDILTIPVKSQFSGHLWYFYFLVWLYLFSPIISSLYRGLTEKQRWFFVLITIVLPMALVLYQQVLKLDATNIVPTTFLYMTFPYAGMMVLGRMIYDGLPRVRHKGLLSILLAVGGFGAMLILTAVYSRAGGKQTELFTPEARLFPVLYGAGVFSLAWCMREAMEKIPAALRRLTRFLSKQLLGVYAFHCVIQWALPSFTLLGIVFTRTETAWKTMVFCILYYCISVYCVAMASKIPLLRKLVT